jgi:hypothetical protein
VCAMIRASTTPMIAKTMKAFRTREGGSKKWQKLGRTGQGQSKERAEHSEEGGQIIEEFGR